MSSKLIRALQRGGCVVEVQPNCWDVWRGRDRRGRSIGQLSDADIQVLKIQGNLSHLGGAEDGRLVWSGGVSPGNTAVSSPAALVGTANDKRGQIRSQLQRLLEDARSAQERRQLAQAALDFAEDVERAETSGAAKGMNWSMIATGGRIQGGVRADSCGRIGYASRSAQRLQLLQDRLASGEYTLLRRLIVERVSRNALARWLNEAPLDAQRRARHALRHLAKIYAEEISRPARATPRSDECAPT